MGLLSTIGTAGAVLGTCLAGFVTKIAADEFAACASSWAKWIVRRAARSLPEEERVASEAEWLAHVDDVPGNMSKLLHACGLWRMTFAGQLRAAGIKNSLSMLFRSVTFVKFIQSFAAVACLSMMSVFIWDILTRNYYYKSAYRLAGSIFTALVGTICSTILLWRIHRKRSST